MRRLAVLAALLAAATPAADGAAPAVAAPAAKGAGDSAAASSSSPAAAAPAGGSASASMYAKHARHAWCSAVRTAYRSNWGLPATATLVVEIAVSSETSDREMIRAYAEAGVPDPRLEEFRWALEELRVSLFAQELRTPYPVSYKRLEKMWGALRQAA